MSDINWRDVADAAATGDDRPAGPGTITLTLDNTDGRFDDRYAAPRWEGDVHDWETGERRGRIRLYVAEREE